MDKPAGSCECVAHLGWCSHQLALILFVNFIQCFPLDTTSDKFCEVYPPNPFLAQREGCPWTFAVGKGTKEEMKCLDKMKWSAKKPDKPRDVAAKLVCRVQEWTERWKTMVHEGNAQHAMSRAKVFIHFLTLRVCVLCVVCVRACCVVLMHSLPHSLI